MSDGTEQGNGHPEPPPGQVVVTITMIPTEHGHNMALAFPEGYYLDDVLAICRRAVTYLERLGLMQEMNAATQRAIDQRSHIVKAIGRDPRGLLS